MTNLPSTKHPLSWIRDLNNIIFPALCAGCRESLYAHEHSICTSCQYGLPYTEFSRDPNNPVRQLFYGRAEVMAATSFLRFSQGGKVQELLHQLKYNGHTRVGEVLGEWMGRELRDIRPYNLSQAIVPVPLHIRKYRTRGYNQCRFIADGLGRAMGIRSRPNALMRVRHTSSQTRKSRFDRWQNTKTVFKVAHPKEIEGKNILLVDDVVTTGSTLEACVHALKQVDGVKVSVATLAFA